MKLALSRKNLWEKLPPRLKAALGSGLGRVPVALLLGARFRAHLRFVTESQWWPAERIREYQLNQLRQVCKIAYERTAYYRRTFDEAGFRPDDLKSCESLAGLPTIDKDTVIRHIEEMCAADPRGRGVDEVSTGGTGGTPLRFYIGAGRSAVEYAYLTAGWQRAGYRLGAPLAVFRGRVVEPDRSGLRHAYDPLLRHHYYSNFHMTGGNMDRYLEHVRSLGPCFLHVYPSSVSALARHVRASGGKPPDNIRGIIAESEIVYPEQRRLAEEVFNCRYFSCYGHSEKLVAACECEHSTDDHVWPTYGYFELLDEDGRAVTTPGQRGEIVGTGFMNEIMPFIRYRTGDMAAYVGERCGACGREHMIVREIRGHRTQECLVASDGAEISWTALNMHDDTFDNVRQFQFLQEEPGRAELRLVPAGGFDDGAAQRIRANLGRKFAGRLAFDLTVVEEIPLSARGKAIYVDQRIPTAATIAG